MSLPIPDVKSIQGIAFLSIQGTKKRESKPEVKGLLDIKADRPGVEISVDGFKQEPILGRLEMPEGKHHIEVFVPDTNYSYTFTAAISAAQPVKEVVAMYGTLEVESFWLQDGLKTSGPPLDVYINGKHVGKSQLRLDNLAAGHTSSRFATWMSPSSARSRSGPIPRCA